ncbi:hypothetical protein [Kitasatospora sp. CB01950]|uniref:hypothetical protein n=1 Tax=Kitasatospora sp. CB01950 TaxID=1703930 RepID=UPI00093CEAD1|nr:hypothetical protein [Kitasatospora sp. CB01950]OKJ13647.1 hypothetical protein AMK19_09370 [Kitasatospora sp. CB01950]
MICPHCQTDLLQRNRPGHRCSHCGKTFALDPKVEPGRLHDSKFRELVAKGTGGTLKITVEQLYWLNERRLHRFPDAMERQGTVVAGVTLTVVAVVAGAIAAGVGSFVWFLLGPVALIAAAFALQQFVGSRRLKSESPLTPRVRRNEFQRAVIDRWRAVYGTLPGGLLEHPPTTAGPSTVKARAVVLCEVPSVAAFLRANDFPERQQVLLVTELAKVPAELPVVVLRDLSLVALERTVTIRAKLHGRRVVDAGLAPRAVFAPAKAVRLHDAPRRTAPWTLAASPGWQRLTEQERNWLTDGWDCPLITLPPAKLLALAEKAVGRAVQRAVAPVPAQETPAQTRRRAERIGFLSWPAAPPAGGAG